LASTADVSAITVAHSAPAVPVTALAVLAVTLFRAVLTIEVWLAGTEIGAGTATSLLVTTISEWEILNIQNISF